MKLRLEYHIPHYWYPEPGVVERVVAECRYKMARELAEEILRRPQFFNQDLRGHETVLTLEVNFQEK